MKDLINRWKAPTPKSFKKLQKIGVSLGGASVALAMIPHVPLLIVTAATHLAVAGGITTVIAQFGSDIVSSDDSTATP